jgi:hypothetical protein
LRVGGQARQQVRAQDGKVSHDGLQMSDAG